jgi:hypothetical protein
VADIFGENNLAAANGKEQVELAGSVFLNNTSYSGCDIKILLNTHTPDQGLKEHLLDIEKEIDKSQSEIRRLQSLKSEAENRLDTVYKRGTPEHQAASNFVAKWRERIFVLQEYIDNLHDRQGVLEKAARQPVTKVLAEAQTLSVSIFRDKQAVRACGSVYPKGFTRGPREIAGSLVFTVFNEHVLHRFLEAHPSDFDANTFTSALMDQLPPVDILISFANEYGHISRMTIYGVEFMSEGQTMSVEDILTENVVHFVARDLDPMRAKAQRKVDNESHRLQRDLGKRASDLILEEDYQAMKSQVNPYIRFKRRRNPFL